MIKYQPLFCSPEESDHIHFSSPAWYFPSAYSQHTHAQLHSITCTPWSQCQRGLSLMGEWEFWRQMSVCQAPPSAASRRTAGSRWRGIKNKNKNNQEEDEEKETGGGVRQQIMTAAWLTQVCIKQEGKGVDHECFVFSFGIFSPTNDFIRIASRHQRRDLKAKPVPVVCHMCCRNGFKHAILAFVYRL